MQDFSYISAQTIPEAVALLDEKGESARILAGGTDLIVQVREARRDVDWMIDIKSIPEVNVLNYDATTGLTLGAAVECYKIYADAAICDAYPSLIDATKILVVQRFKAAPGSAETSVTLHPLQMVSPP